MKYLLDTNVFIQAWKVNYKPDCRPEFWDWLIQKNEEDKIYSIKELLNEMRRKNDDLAEWVVNLDNNFFIEMNSDVGSKRKVISEWIQTQEYTSAAVGRFNKDADSFLVAHALSTQGGFIVVTQEKPEDSKNKIKIPNVCDNFGIGCMTTQDLLQNEKAPFVP